VDQRGGEAPGEEQGGHIGEGQVGPAALRRLGFGHVSPRGSRASRTRAALVENGFIIPRPTSSRFAATVTKSGRTAAARARKRAAPVSRRRPLSLIGGNDQ